MYNLLAILSGAVIALMILVNGKLSEYYGVYSGAVIVHLIGLIIIFAAVFIRKEKIKPDKKIPFYFFTGGAIGVATTVFNNLAFGAISISAILALGLLGQSLTSIVIDEFGLFSMPRQSFNKKKLIGFLFVLIGMLFLIL